MSKNLTFRALRKVTHIYVSDALELDPHNFQAHGAPQDPEAFMAWIVEHAQDLLSHEDLGPEHQGQLRKLGFFQEDRARRDDITLCEGV